MTLSMLDHALQYARLGWSVFPVRKNKTPYTENGFLDATTDETQISAWWNAHKGAGIAVATGKVSGIVVLDIDNKDDRNGSESLKSFLAQRKLDLKTPVMSITGSGGYHIFFKYPDIPEDHKITNHVNFLGLAGLDIRGDGGYIVLPPSLHPSNNRYAWGENQTPFDNELPDCPEFIKENPKSPGINFTDKIPDGQRNAVLTQHAGLMRSMGMGRDMIFTLLMKDNDDHCDPPLDSEEIELIVDSIMRYPPFNTRQGNTTEEIDLRQLLQFNHTDTGAAELLAFCNKNTIKFNHQMGKWMIYRNGSWSIDSSGEMVQIAIDSARSLYNAARFEDDEDLQAAIMKRARTLENARSVQNTLTIAKTLPIISTSGYEWNNVPNLLGVKNGILDLNTGELREGTPDDLINIYTPVPYIKDASAPRWSQFLHEIFDNDESVINFIHRAIGYSLTGYTIEQSLFMCVGNGANGKSVLLDTIRKVLGEYAYSAPFTTFEKSANPSQQSNDIAALVNKRFVTASETNEGSSINEARIKGLTGGEEITARFLHQEFFAFKPVCKIWLGVNHLPRVRDDSNGFWRRVKKIDFPITFSGDKADKTLADTLNVELPGILNWCVQGALLWRESGLQVPSSVIASVEEYKSDSDPIRDFVYQCLEAGNEYITRSDELYRQYVRWCNDNQLKPYERLASDKFHARLQRDYKRITDESGYKAYIGVRVKPSINENGWNPVVKFTQVAKTATKYVS